MPPSLPLQPLTVSADGYIRLTLPQLHAIPLHHLISGLDEPEDEQPGQAASYSEITGYTEWISGGSPALTIGWDWQMLRDAAQPTMQRLNAPKSNIMLTDDSSKLDLGQDETLLFLERFVDQFQWQPAVLAHLNVRYPG